MDRESKQKKNPPFFSCCSSGKKRKKERDKESSKTKTISSQPHSSCNVNLPTDSIKQTERNTLQTINSQADDQAGKSHIMHDAYINKAGSAVVQNLAKKFEETLSKGQKEGTAHIENDSEAVFRPQEMKCATFDKQIPETKSQGGKIVKENRQALTNNSLQEGAGADITFKKSFPDNRSISNIISQSQFPSSNELPTDEHSKRPSQSHLPICEAKGAIEGETVESQQISELMPNILDKNNEENLSDEEREELYFNTRSVISSTLYVPKTISSIVRAEDKATIKSSLPRIEHEELVVLSDTNCPFTPRVESNFLESSRSMIPPKSNTVFNINFHPIYSKEVYEKIERKEKEIKKLNEKINKILSDLAKCEEENRRYECGIDKEQSDGEVLRHMLNFLQSKTV